MSFLPSTASTPPQAGSRRGDGNGKDDGPRSTGHNGANGWSASRQRANGRRRPPKAALVAGGAGFIGSHLCDRLIAEGRRVYCVDSFYTGLSRNIEHLANEPRFVLMEHDVRTALPLMGDVGEVYNLACPASPPHYQKDPIYTVTTNVMGTLNLVELASALGARFLHTSTSEVYGDPEVHPQTESYRGCVNPTGPRACYDEGKRVAETLCFDFRRMNRADVRVARIFNTYGPRMRPDDGRIISNLATQALRGEPMTIYGDGLQTRSFCYVSDLVEGLVRLMSLERAPATPLNLGNPGEFTVLDVAELIARLTGSDLPIVYRPLPQDDPQRRRPDIGLAQRLLDWAPDVPLRRGLLPTIRWFAGEIGGPLAAALDLPEDAPRVGRRTAAAGLDRAAGC